MTRKRLIHQELLEMSEDIVVSIVAEVTAIDTMIPKLHRPLQMGRDDRSPLLDAGNTCLNDYAMGGGHGPIPGLIRCTQSTRA
jgi:hypothetical protein